MCVASLSMNSIGTTTNKASATLDSGSGGNRVTLGDQGVSCAEASTSKFRELVPQYAVTSRDADDAEQRENSPTAEKVGYREVV